MIAKITATYTRRYSDNGQVTTYVEWIDRRGKMGPHRGQRPELPHGRATQASRARRHQPRTASLVILA